MTKLFAKIAILSCIGFCACSNRKETKNNVQETAVTEISNQKSANTFVCSRSPLRPTKTRSARCWPST